MKQIRYLCHLSLGFSLILEVTELMEYLGTERPELGRRAVCQSRQKIFDSQVIPCLCSCAAPFHVGENSSNVESLGAERAEQDRSPIWSLGSTSSAFSYDLSKENACFPQNSETVLLFCVKFISPCICVDSAKVEIVCSDCRTWEEPPGKAAVYRSHI